MQNAEHSLKKMNLAALLSISLEKSSKREKSREKARQAAILPFHLPPSHVMTLRGPGLNRVVINADPEEPKPTR